MTAKSHETIDGDLLGFFRVAFGLLNAYGAWRTLHHKVVNFQFHFTYQGLPVPMLGEQAYQVLVWTTLISALGIAIGRGTRFWAGLYFLSYGYWFLLEKSNFNNHYYLILILAFFFMMVGDGGFLSWRGAPGKQVPVWHLNLFRYQLILVYFYGGVSKLHRDWFLGNPMRDWLADHSWWLSRQALWFSYGGLLFDLLIGPALLYRRTRVPALLLAFGFHLCNSQLFKIGIFPYLMMGSLVLFLDPGQVRRVCKQGGPEASTSSNQSIPWGWYLFALWQILMPLRHHLYPGNVDWNGEGAHFAWRMKLLDRSGKIDFIVESADGRRQLVEPSQELSPRQVKSMKGHPELIVDYARHLRRSYQQPGHPAPKVKVLAWISLNHRKQQFLFEPELDVGSLDLPLWGHNPHILPLTQRISENPRLAAWLRLLFVPAAALSYCWMRRSQGVPRGWGVLQWCVLLQVATSTLASNLFFLGTGIATAWLAAASTLKSRRPGLILYSLYQVLWLTAIWLAATAEPG